MERAVLPWLEQLLLLENNSKMSNENNHYYYQQWETRLRFHVYEAFGNLRMNETFDIIKEYPESQNAILDLQTSLSHTLQHQQVVNILNNSIFKRLLQPGVKTSQIITLYILVIKSLRELDSSGVLLEGVSEPIKAVRYILYVVIVVMKTIWC